MKQAWFGLLGWMIAGVAFADAAAAPVPGMPGTTGHLPASVPFAPPGSTVTTVTTTIGPQSSPVPAPAAAPAPVQPAVATSSSALATAAVNSPNVEAGARGTEALGIATGVAPPPVLGPGAVGMPQSVSPTGTTPAAGGPAAPAVQLVDPKVFGTLQDPAFQGMTEKMFPMTADQIRALREVYETTKRLTAEPPRTPPRPTVSSQTISLAPGTVPPVIRLANGYVSSIVFVDETGAPWPVTSYSVGNPHAFNIQWDSESNLLLIQGQGAYVSGNMAVTLKKLDTPIMLTIVSEQNVVDYRVDFRVQGRGPNANGSIIASSLPQNSNQLLMSLLDGVAPSDAKMVTVTGGPAQAWVRGGTLFLRTPLTVLSPSWTATMTSPDGTKVYQMNSTPLILASDRGQSLTLKVLGL